MKKIFALALAVLMIVGGMSACTPSIDLGTGYTYRSYSTALGTNWNPHTWETDADSAVMAYIETPLVDMSIKNSETGEFQWVFEAATSVEDVTAKYQDALTKYAVTLPEGKTAADITEGYVFEIKLNPNMKWENGTVINADTYIYSMKALLDPAMRNYRSNLYWSGESAVAGGYTYYNSGAPIYAAVVPAYDAEAGETGDYSFDTTANKVFINPTSNEMTIAGYSFSEICSDYGYITAEAYAAATEGANAYGYVEITDANKDAVLTAMDQYLSAFGMSIYNEDKSVNEELYKEFLFYFTGENSPKADYDATVGCYKVDDYTIHYVCQTAIERNYFLTSCTSNWLVYEDLYEGGKDTTGELVTTNYGTPKETTMSYGPYKLESLETDKQMVFVQNENWYDYEKTEDGKLVSYTNFEVDGKSVQQYQTTKVLITVMDADAAKQAFLKGDLSEWSPNADELLEYSTSDNLYKADETFTMSFFFNTDLEALKEMDKSKGNVNSVVLSNINFRKAMSLALDRADFVSATEGWKPAFALMNNLYYYDIYNDPTTSYRGSEQAMQGVCNLYGVKYGEGTPYATLEDAYKSITGYNLTEAKSLMATACKELVDAGLYTEGQEIKIRIGWAKGAKTSADEKQVVKINEYINAALEGSGFGKITFEAIDNIPDRYSDVANGEYAIGWGAWGGAAFYPFRNMQVYCDTANYSIHEKGCWDPAAENLTIKIDGEDVTMSWMEWSNALIGTGPYANADFDTKLHVTATMEEEYLKKYYRIPFAGTTVCSMLGDQLNFYTEDYNIMYGWGGLQLATWNYNDTEWYNYVQSNNGTLNYQ